MNALLLASSVLCILSTAVLSAATTIRVPDDQPTIQAGIDAASAGDTVLVACGTYYEHDIDLKLGVCLRSATGYPDCVTIDAQRLGRVISCGQAGSDTRLEGITIANGRLTTPGATAAGMLSGGSPTITHVVFSGNTVAHIGGTSAGALRCETPTLTHVTFVGNGANGDGGAMCCGSACLTDVVFSGNEGWWGCGGGLSCWGSPTLTDVVFSGNFALGGSGMSSSGSPQLTRVTFDGNMDDTGSGGAFRCSGGNPLIMDATFVHNPCGMLCVSGATPTVEGAVFWGNGGAAIHCQSGASATIEQATFYENEACEEAAGVQCEGGSSVRIANSIIAFNTGGAAVYCDDTSNATLWCCDLYGNSGGDWVGCIANQEHTNYNICANPLFCLSESPIDPLSLCEDSPCIRPVCGGCIGARGIGCGQAVAVERTSWGVVKSMFR